MQQTYTFTSHCGRFVFTIKESFLDKVPKPEEVDLYDLYTQFHMFDYLHNESGPAVIHKGLSYDEYWIDGKRLSIEDVEKIKAKETK